MYQRFLLIFIALFIFSCVNGQAIVDDLSINPNPFQKRTSFTYSFINNDTVSVNILDIIGNNIYSPITNSVMPSGIYQDSLIMDSYADGIYFVQLKLGHRKTISKKIIKSNTAAIVVNANSLNGVRIYPNPLINKLNINFEMNRSENNNIQITNTLGQTIYSKDTLTQKQEIDLSFLESGIYYLRVEGFNVSKVFKIIKE
jgi:hypothetical protein